MGVARTTGPLVDAFHDGLVSRREFVAGALRIGLSTSAAGALLAACSKSSTSKSSTSKSSTSATSSTTTATKLTGSVQVLVGFGTGNSPDQIPVQQALAQAFMQKNPGVTINFLRVTGGSSNAGTKLTTLIAGGAAPDIAIPVGIYGVSLFVDQGVFLDLEDYFKRDGLSLDQFLPSSYSAVHVPNYFGANSTAIIGVPIGVNDHALAYNEELFSKAGVAPPPTAWTDASWTLEANGTMLKAATALTLDAKGRHPGDAGFDPSNIVQYGLGNFFRETVFYDFGGHLYDASSRKAQFDTPDSIAGIQFAADLVNTYHVEPTQTALAALGAGAGANGDQAQFAWRAGKLAMIDMCTCNIKTPYAMNVPFSFKAAAMPMGPKRRFCFLNLDVGTIMKASKNKDLAWEVLKYLTFDPTAESQLAYESDGSIPPLTTNSQVFTQGISHDLPNVDPATWVNGLPYASEENETWFPAFAPVNTLIGNTFDSIIAGKATAAQAMPALQQQAQAQIQQWFATHKLAG